MQRNFPHTRLTLPREPRASFALFYRLEPSGGLPPPLRFNMPDGVARRFDAGGGPTFPSEPFPHLYFP
eukprot:296817-Chlamydomonas_euryale.AAC.1